MTSSALTPRDVLTPEALAMIQRIAELGSFAAAARATGQVPSALSYRVRQIEEALDVLLFDRSARQARLTEAGGELLREGARLLGEIDAIANRVKRVATGWEPRLTIAVDSIIHRTTVLELCEAFFALGAPTRLRLRQETLSGTLETLGSGEADLALGVAVESISVAGVQGRPLGSIRFLFAVAPHHPLARAPEPLSDELIGRHRAVAVADTVRVGSGQTVGLLGGQDVFTVPNLEAKLEAQLRGIGAGFLPECLVRSYADSGRLVTKAVQRSERVVHLGYAWRAAGSGVPRKALQWWLERLEHAATRAALLGVR
ncbi:MAG TPA: LysR family transcriptional regulator [Rhodocyclaceae bacterium]|nr:LysR family transcriptional regulator [Rhodocyclaceae bacterium]HMV63595.1 LysR family transcriptional regulator [Rhodocyclaceae bacterium]HMY49184.1 LysR family transcriptional regulator [Rhodocyclaceae bacterium]HMZ76628.1 LysR family transcriptional regulator [Rhodocyclaceae bacterium]HNC79024.1 LysR family transcriptional regulator [Rhodocyclaceae bacterium]